MTKEEALKKLKAAQKRAAKIRTEIDNLREVLRGYGVDENTQHRKLIQRNIRIYKRWKKGWTFTELATEYNLSGTRIGGICRRIEYIVTKRKGDLKPYRTLLKK